MNNRKVPRSEWYRFFQDFSRRHHDTLVDIAILGEKFGAQHEIQQLPLDGIVADRAGTQISILLGNPDASSLDHPIDQPAQVWVEQDEAGEEFAIAIEAADGVKTILQVVPSLVRAS